MFFAALLALVVVSATAFNLEPRLAIVKEGTLGSYFGYAVSQHQMLLHKGSKAESVLLVGAPLDGGQGSLWRCPFTARPDDCVRLDVDPNVANGSEKGGQWLGAVVRSQGPGKQVITCAPRYVKEESDQRWGHGKCFTLTQTLEHSATWDPCEGREKNRAHEEWGFCQAGISALLTEDNTALIGSPGPFTWRGTVFALSVDDDFLFRDKSHYHVPVRQGEAPVEKYAYLGMSLEAGNFLSPHQSCGKHQSYAAGAPRAGGTGKVVLFVKCLSDMLKVQRIISGETFASSFGYALASADMSGNGFVDLVVGAPFYHDSAEKRGGAVYVYANDVDGLALTPSARLFGSPESRFGFALSNAGDLNNDGFQDLVVGAPYDGRGKIFIYMGRAAGLRDGQAADQVISAEQIRGRFPSKTFGYSLSGGMDMDANNHSDLVVGAYESDIAVILRSRPVIDIVTWFGEHPQRVNPEVQGCQEDLLSPEVCFNVESCFLIKNFPSNIETTYIRYSLEAEVFPGGRKVSRVRFGGHASNATHVSEKVIAVRRNSLTGCFLETAYLRRETTDLTTPLTFLLSLKLEQDEPASAHSGISNINQYPILNQREATKEITLSFQKSCGGDDLCNSALSAKLVIEGFDEKSRRLEIRAKSEVQLIVKVANAGEPAYAAVVNLQIDPAFSFVGRSDNASDISCEYSESAGSIVCQLGNPYEGQRFDELRFRILPKSTMQQQKEVQFNISCTTTSEDPEADKVRAVRVVVVQRAEVSIRSSVQPHHIWYGGQLLGESAMKVMSDIGSRVTHTFQVTNDGPWHMDQFEVLIDWPYQLAVPGRASHEPGKWLLYLAGDAEVSPAGSGHCFINPRMINQLGLRENRQVPKRKRRKRRRRRRRSADNGYNVLSCADDRTKCQVITCRIHRLRANEDVVVRLRSRVWNSTLVEEFSSRSDVVQLEVGARILLHPDSEQLQRTDDDVTVATLVAFPSSSASQGLDDVPSWVILLAVAIGLVLVTIIITVLYKFGFFKRHRHTNDILISAKVTSAASAKGDEYIS